MTLCLMTMFKNERHIMYEFVQHYICEGVDKFILIDDNSDDNYLEYNKSWIIPFIENKTIIIVKNTFKQARGQVLNYNKYLNLTINYDWLIVCDFDEFIFGVDNTLKQLLNNKLSNYNYIRFPWKLFNHLNYLQPKSVIENNVYTHLNPIDKSSRSKGYKYIVRPKGVSKFDVHDCNMKNGKKLELKSCHNELIQNNHYRTQSEEFLMGQKMIRGSTMGHVSKYSIKNIEKREKCGQIYNKKCDLLKKKRKELI